MIRIALAQINSTVGDFEGNFRKMADFIVRAKKAGAHLVVFPELAVTGYPPEDLLLKPRFIEKNLEITKKLIGETDGICAVWGFVDQPKKNGLLWNAAMVAQNRRRVGIYHKQCLPNYSVFDELRYFAPGEENRVFTVRGVRFGLSICEDMWRDDGPLPSLIRKGKIQAAININASPYHRGKWKEREELIRKWATRGKIPFCYVNMVGGQDELVFDGHSVVMDGKGRVVTFGKQFEEDLVIYDVDLKVKVEMPKPHMTLPPDAEIYSALVLGTRDYIRKNGFHKVVIGLSGGIDSALVACVAVDALGKENVVGVSLPSHITSTQSRDDAKELAGNLDIDFREIAIRPVYDALVAQLAPTFKDRSPDITEENLQARIRGNILMALSNKFGWIVLTTGNKSEMSAGYATLYGDMAGGFAVLKDVPKTVVYQLSRYVNGRAGRDIIPNSILTKAPTAELRSNQTDQDSLPPYDVLDAIIEAYVEENHHFDEIVKKGFDPAIVRKVITLIDRSEYKRRQAPPGIKITPRAFGKDWRLPITNKFT